MTPRPGRTRTGRTALTPEVQAQICNALLLGADYATAAEYGGITYTTLRLWMRRGEAGERPFASFVDAIKKATADAVVRHLGQIEEAATARVIACKGVVSFNGKCEVCGSPFHVERRCRNSIELPGQWTAAAWKLERRHPDRFGQRQRVEVSQALSGEQQILLMRELAEAVTAEVHDQEVLGRIDESWQEVGRRLGHLESTPETEEADRRVRARRAHRGLLPGSPP